MRFPRIQHNYLKFFCDFNKILAAIRIFPFIVAIFGPFTLIWRLTMLVLLTLNGSPGVFCLLDFSAGHSHQLL